MYNKTILSLFVTIALSIQGMDINPKKSKKLIVRALRAIPKPFKSTKTNTIRTDLSFNVDEVPENAALVLNIDEIIKPVIKQLCFHPHSTYKNIYDFSLVNKKINSHYTCSPQIIIRRFAKKQNISTFNELSNIKSDFALPIQKEMDRLKTIALFKSRIFIQEDLINPWYLKATYDGYDHCPHITLLHMTIEDLNFRKTEFIINKMKENNIAIPSNSLALLAGLKAQLEPADIDCIDKRELQTFYDIAQLLLENGAHPDNRLATHFFTLLHKASLSGAKNLAELLLQYGANPYEEYIEKHNKKYMQSGDEKEPWKNNAFTLEAGEPKGWLKIMYDKTSANTELPKRYIRRFEKKKAIQKR